MKRAPAVVVKRIGYLVDVALLRRGILPTGVSCEKPPPHGMHSPPTVYYRAWWYSDSPGLVGGSAIYVRGRGTMSPLTTGCSS